MRSGFGKKKLTWMVRMWASKGIDREKFKNRCTQIKTYYAYTAILVENVWLSKKTNILGTTHVEISNWIKTLAGPKLGL